MHKAIRIKCRQNLVNFRKPTSLIIKETYPLPPYSTVIGMIHNACDFNEYHPMNLSIQGDMNCTVADLYTRYSFGRAAGYEAARHQDYVRCGDKKHGIFKGIANTELICELDLMIHIVPENDDDFDSIFYGLTYPKTYLSLGRHEDLVDIYEIKIVEFSKEDEVILKNDAYIPIEQLEEKKEGTVYLVNKEYTIGKNGVRHWNSRIKTKCVSKFNILYEICADQDGYVVALA